MFFFKIFLSIINGAFSFGENLKEHRKHCALTVKDKGPRKNKRCAFPFRFEGKLYKGVCTNEKVISYFHSLTRFNIFDRLPIMISWIRFLISFRIQMAFIGVQLEWTEKLVNILVEKITGDIANQAVTLDQMWMQRYSWILYFRWQTNFILYLPYLIGN